MSEIDPQPEDAHVPDHKIKNSEREIRALFLETRKIFGAQYKANGNVSVLIAQNEFEETVASGAISIADAKGVLRDPIKFATLLLQKENTYQSRENSKIHDRLSGLEVNTSEGKAYKIAGVAGGVLGAVSLLISPFSTNFLQPYADALFKRKTVSTLQCVLPVQPITRITGPIIIINNHSLESAHRPTSTESKKSKKLSIR